MKIFQNVETSKNRKRTLFLIDCFYDSFYRVKYFSLAHIVLLENLLIFASHIIPLIGEEMTKTKGNANKNLERVIALCSEALELADLGDHHREDDGCGVVFGTMRDSAYKIRRLAKAELARHEGVRKL